MELWRIPSSRRLTLLQTAGLLRMTLPGIKTWVEAGVLVPGEDGRLMAWQVREFIGKLKRNELDLPDTQE